MLSSQTFMSACVEFRDSCRTLDDILDSYVEECSGSLGESDLLLPGGKDDSEVLRVRVCS